MRILRFILAGLVAVTALVAVFFAAAVVVVSGVIAYVMQLFRGKASPARSGRPRSTARQPNLSTDDVIDV